MFKNFKIKNSLTILLASILLFTGVSCGVSTNEHSEKDETTTIFSSLITENDFTTGTDNNITKNETNSTSASTIYNSNETSSSKVTTSEIPSYSGNPYVVINNNKPIFNQAELTTKAYEKYSSLDSLGRCGVAIASCGKEIMPTESEKRGSISSIKPTGWNQAKYDGISGGYLWNRCHLIGWQLSAENANKQNLITGTRYMNINGMLPFENMVADYIKETGNHVAYRVTPVYQRNNLVCSGVQIEAYSIEDNGKGISFNVFCYNVQPNITINYADGSSSSSTSSETTTKQITTVKQTTTTKIQTTTTKQTTTTTKKTTTTQSYDDNQSGYVWIPNSGKKYHSHSGCSNMKNPSKVTLSEAKSLGFTACSKCW